MTWRDERSISPGDGTAHGVRRGEWRSFASNHRALVGACVVSALAFSALLARSSPPTIRRTAPRRGGEGRQRSAPDGNRRPRRDVLSRALWGGQVTQLVGLLSMAVSIVVGVTVGGLAGFYGRGIDGALMRLTETVVTFPTFFLLITLVAVFEERACAAPDPGHTAWRHSRSQALVVSKSS